MSFDPISAVSNLVSTVVSRIWPDATEQEKAKLALQEMEENGQLQIIMKQLDINLAEAQNKSIFVSGWRPFVGWVCASAFAFQYIVQPMIETISTTFGHPIVLPKLDYSQMGTVLMGLLGLGGMRTYEKQKGVNDQHG